MNEGFVGFGKIARLARDMIITEKLDGTNAQVYVECVPRSDMGSLPEGAMPVDIPGVEDHRMVLRAGSRNRWLVPEVDDNFGFAHWVSRNREELALLGEGRHFGEWWGKGIQRGYGLGERRFSLFNVRRWGDIRPTCCDVVPVLCSSDRFDTYMVERVMDDLMDNGSYAAPGYMDPEGVIVYHTASNTYFKRTLDGDAKSLAAARSETKGR